MVRLGDTPTPSSAWPYNAHFFLSSYQADGQVDTLILVLNTEAVAICATHHLTCNPAGSSHILCFRDMAPKAPNKLRKKLQRKEQEILEAPHSAASKGPNGNSLCCVPKGKKMENGKSPDFFQDSFFESFLRIRNWPITFFLLENLPLMRETNLTLGTI